MLAPLQFQTSGSFSCIVDAFTDSYWIIMFPVFAMFFRHQLCRSKVYCRTVGDRQGELHDLLDKLMTKTQKLSDSSVCLYYFRYNLMFNN